MELPAAVRRPGYRIAHCALRVYWFLARPHKTGVKCVLTDSETVLLVRHTYGHRAWDLPGGSIRRGEQPHGAASREMQEELGISIREWVPLGELRASIHHRQDIIHCFGAELLSPELEIDRGELAAASWFPRSQLPGDLGRYVLPIISRSPTPTRSSPAACS